MSRYNFDDKWIIEHEAGMSARKLFDEYKIDHEAAMCYHTFARHLREITGRDVSGKHYTDTEKQFLRVTYPVHGSRKTAEMFKEEFGRNVSADSLKTYCRRSLGLSVPKKVRYQNVSAPIGTISENCRGEVKVKTENGWIKATHSKVDVPKGMIAFNLDRDKYNNEPENIGITTNSKFRFLRNHGFWSEEREITKTGLLLCDLHELMELENEAYKHEKGEIDPDID